MSSDDLDIDPQIGEVKICAKNCKKLLCKYFFPGTCGQCRVKIAKSLKSVFSWQNIDSEDLLFNGEDVPPECPYYLELLVSESENE